MTKEGSDLVMLVIEDNDMFRKLAIDMLGNHQTYSASSVEQGIKMYKQYKPNLTFIDIGLPDGSGLDVVTKIKEEDADAFMVMLTASNLQSDVQESLNNGARGYIVKPFSRQKIKESIEQYYNLVKKHDKA